MKQSNQFHLPHEIITEILLRLPFESILHSKLVSKQWKNLIHHPSFFKLYRGISLAVFLSQNGNCSCVLTRHGNNNNNKVAGTINSRSHPPFSVHTIHPIYSSKPERRIFPLRLISAPSKGVSCLYDAANGHFLFRNLFTGESYTVPFPDVRHKKQLNIHRPERGLFGIGYDGYSDDYKIMIALIKSHSSSTEDDGLFWVYSFRNRSWKSFDGFPYAAYDWTVRYNNCRSCSVSGVLHFGSTLLNGPRGQFVIVIYDLHTSTFGEMSVPPVADNGLSAPSLAELGGHLCYSVCGSKFYLWVMKEYGVSESWTMLCSIEYMTISRNIIDRLEPIALHECKDGRKYVLFACQLYGTLYWYNINNSKVKRVHQSTWKKRN